MSRFFVNMNLHSTTFLSSGRSTCSHVLFLTKMFTSFAMAPSYSSESCLFRASFQLEKCARTSASKFSSPTSLIWLILVLARGVADLKMMTICGRPFCFEIDGMLFCVLSWSYYTFSWVQPLWPEEIIRGLFLPCLAFGLSSSSFLEASSTPGAVSASSSLHRRNQQNFTFESLAVNNWNGVLFSRLPDICTSVSNIIYKIYNFAPKRSWQT